MSVNDFLEEKNCLENAEIHIIGNDGRQTKDLIREHLDDFAERPTDLIFVGNTGADFSKSKDLYLGSVANEIICHTKYNVVFVS